MEIILIIMDVDISRILLTSIFIASGILVFVIGLTMLFFTIKGEKEVLRPKIDFRAYLTDFTLDRTMFSKKLRSLNTSELLMLREYFSEIEIGHPALMYIDDKIPWIDEFRKGGKNELHI